MKMSRVHHALAVAALMAMTLLACMPTVSRVRHAASPWERGASHDGGHAAHGGQMPATPAAGDACDYCALLGGFAPPAPTHIDVQAHLPASSIAGHASRHAIGHGGWTLGSRGPPASRAG